jgi:DNA-binding NarL/FixJ family response regulator
MNVRGETVKKVSENKEIAEIVGTSEGTIKWYISTLAKRFKDYMEKNS